MKNGAIRLTNDFHLGFLFYIYMSFTMIVSAACLLGQFQALATQGFYPSGIIDFTTPG